MSGGRRVTLTAALVAVAAVAAIWLARSPAQVNAEETPMPGMEMPGNGKTSGGPKVSGYAELTLSSAIQQRIGVTLGEVRQAPLSMTIRTVAIVRPDETKLAKIHVKTEGWIDRLFVSFTGQQVKAGDPMLSIYSPQFYSAEAEYLITFQPGLSGDALRGARRRLELWDIPEEELKRLETTRVPQKILTLRTPVSGTVLERKAVAGQYVRPETELYTIADLSTVWLQAKVYEYELPHVEIGQAVSVTLSAFPGEKFTGKVVFIEPTVEEPARTVQVRIELPNPEGKFKPGMFGHVVITHEMGTGLVAPTSAIIRTGERDIAFRVEGIDRFVPVEVEVSPMQFGDTFQILKGLKAGDKVVTSANFLIDSESRLRVSGGAMAGMAGMEMGPAAKEQSGSEMKDMHH